MKRDKHIYIGLDLHKFQHTAVIVDCWFEKLGEMTFQNKPFFLSTFLISCFLNRISRTML